MQVPTCVFREFPLHALGRMGQKYRPAPLTAPVCRLGLSRRFTRRSASIETRASPPSRRPCRGLYRRGLPSSRSPDLHHERHERCGIRHSGARRYDSRRVTGHPPICSPREGTDAMHTMACSSSTEVGVIQQRAQALQRRAREYIILVATQRPQRPCPGQGADRLAHRAGEFKRLDGLGMRCKVADTSR